MYINHKKTVLYFAPHQDDELLTMGIDICSSLRNNMDVHIVLCTDGSGSVIREKLGDGKTCKKHAGTHSYKLSAEDFVYARDCEFQESCKFLGIIKQNIHIPAHRPADGKMTIAEAKRLMLHYISALGNNCIVCTIAPSNDNRQHPDHKVLGDAATELFNNGKIGLLKLFVEPYIADFQNTDSNEVKSEIRPVTIFALKQEREKLKKATTSYSTWNPEMGQYGIGYHSVTTEFDELLKKGVSYYYIHACRQDSKKLIVSLTSWPGRIHCVTQSLATIFKQTMLPDEVVLWLAESQFPNKLEDLPADLLTLVKEKGVSIQWCDDDLKSHKKYFYVFKKYQDALVITIDDDLLYSPQLIENLYASWILHPDAVSAVRAHLILISETGAILPYKMWNHEMDVCVSNPSIRLLATSGAGSLYPTALFTKVSALLDEETIKHTCLYADDLWLKAMQIVAGIPVVVARNCNRLQYVPQSQDVGLYHMNYENSGNDIQLMQIIQEIDYRYGKNTFLKKLLNATTDKVFVDEKSLNALINCYRNETEELMKEKISFDSFRKSVKDSLFFKVKRKVSQLLHKFGKP